MGAELSTVGSATEQTVGASKTAAGRLTSRRSMALAKRATTKQAPAWGEVYSCGLPDWSKGHGAILGFDPRIDYCIPHYRTWTDVYVQNIQPYCTRGYQFKVEKLHQSNKMAKICNDTVSNGHYTAPEIVNKRHRYEYPVYTPTVNVIGYQRHVAVLQVVYKKTKELHFIAIELNTGRHISVYKDLYVSEPCIYEAYLSPDETQYLLRPNFFFAYSHCSDPFMAFSITKDIRVISVDQPDSVLVSSLEDISHLWHSIAYDPRYGHSRIAVGNYTSQLLGDQLMLYDLQSMKVITQLEERQTSFSHHLVYNPQGSLLVSLGVSLISPRIDLMYPVKVLVYDPCDLGLLQVITRQNVSVNHFHASLTPLFSKTGHYMALVGNFGQMMTVYQMPRDGSLKHLCRLAILKSIPEDKLPHLPLPRRLLEYVQFLPNWP